jgi:hypothetical protein
MLSNVDTSAKWIFLGDISLVVCCAFYLAWWIIAFRPTGAVKGFASGWLLVPAVIFGIAAAVMILYGVSSVGAGTATGSNGQAGRGLLFPNIAVAFFGVIVYIVLLIITWLLLKRQPTTELLLIVCWAALMFVEVNALCATGAYQQLSALVSLGIVVVAVVISLVCYVLFYNLSGTAGFIDGIIPLALLGVVTLGLAIGVAV